MPTCTGSTDVRASYIYSNNSERSPCWQSTNRLLTVMLIRLETLHARVINTFGQGTQELTFKQHLLISHSVEFNQLHRNDPFKVVQRFPFNAEFWLGNKKETFKNLKISSCQKLLGRFKNNLAQTILYMYHDCLNSIDPLKSHGTRFLSICIIYITRVVNLGTTTKLC